MTFSSSSIQSEAEAVAARSRALLSLQVQADPGLISFTVRYFYRLSEFVEINLHLMMFQREGLLRITSKAGAINLRLVQVDSVLLLPTD